LRQQIFGGDSGGVTPVPIPNTEVKPSSADGTWAETPWESRSPPDHAPLGSRSLGPQGVQHLADAGPGRPSWLPGVVATSARSPSGQVATAAGGRYLGTSPAGGTSAQPDAPVGCGLRIVHLRPCWVVCVVGWLLENGREDSTQRVRSVVGRLSLADGTPSMKCLAGSAFGWGWSPVLTWQLGSGLDHCRLVPLSGGVGWWVL
jgi:hypothetical protein